MRTILTVIGLLLFLGCSQPPVADKAPVEDEVVIEKVAEIVSEPTVRSTPTPMRKTVKYDHISDPDYGYFGPASVDEMIAIADIIVRANFRSARTVGVRSPLLTTGSDSDQQYDGYLAGVEFTFDVLEYLTGTRQGDGTEIKAVAHTYDRATGTDGYTAATADQAAELAQEVLAARDTRWDNREAVVFLVQPVGIDGQNLPYLYLGNIGLGSAYRVTVADAEYKRWLPSATSPQQSGSRGVSAQSKSTKRYFLTDEPRSSVDGRGARGSSGPAWPNISLTDLKDKIATINQQVTDGGGSAEYRQCLATTYLFNRTVTPIYTLATGEIESGLPAGTRAVTWDEAIEAGLHIFGPEPPENWHTNRWREGRDAHLLGLEYPGYSTILRPLPAGEYRSFVLSRWDGMAVCDGYPEAVKNQWEDLIVVTAPEGTLAEAFFDPVTDGTATTATTTVGTIRYEANTVKATLIPTVTNHLLDFIALDGSVALSLDVVDATTTDGVLSWTVASAPWSTGDKLMLRIRQPVASVTVTLSPHVEGISTQGFIVIEWVDPAQCDSRYFVGLYSGETVKRIYGFHPAPETTSYSANTRLHWDRIPDSDWTARVTCAPADGSGWNVVAETPIVSGLPASGS